MKKLKIIFSLILVCSVFLLDNVYAIDNYYEIKNYNANIYVDSSYDVFIRNKDNSEVCNKLGIDESQIISYMDARSAYFMTTTSDFQKNIIFTRSQDSYTEDYYNLSDLDSDIVNALADGYSKSFGGNYNIEKINEITYMVFKYDLTTVQNEHLYYFKYKTYYNGYDYTVYIQKYSEITLEDEAELKNVINNFEVKKIEKQNAEFEDNSYLVWIVLFVIAGIIIFIIVMVKKNKNKSSVSDDIVVCPKCGCKVLREFDSCPKCGRGMKK